MSFHHWLPITKRNRVALCLAALSLVMFAVWNCLPWYEGEEGDPTGTMASVFWAFVFSPDIYLRAIRPREIWDFLAIAACLASLSGGVVILLTIPFWEMLHASSYLKLPIAWLNLAGGVAWCWYAIALVFIDTDPYFGVTAFLMSLSLFSISAAFFLFQNELMLRKARNHAATIRNSRSSH
jgi:hypothetical protein